MSWVLGIDTSSTELSIGLLHEGAPCVACSRYVRNSHAEHITTTMKYVLSSSGITAQDITAVGIAVGPGSFTGLRIGISFLKGFFLAQTTPILPVSSLESIAESYQGPSGKIVTAMDARQGKVFCATFTRENHTLSRLTDDTMLPVKEFIDAHTTDLVLFDTLGHKTNTHTELFKDLSAIRYVHDISLHRGLACARCAVRDLSNTTIWTTASEILPNYMQVSYAEQKQQASLHT